MGAISTTAKRNSRRTRSAFSYAGKRLREIERIIKDRHGVVLATDDADLYLSPVAECYCKIAIDAGRPASVDSITERLELWCQNWAPDVTKEQAAQLVREAMARASRLTPGDELGASLRLSHADRARLGIRSIGSYDVSKAARARLNKARRRERDRLRAAEKRKAKGATPRDIYRANSLSATKPWELLRISRRTFERRRKTAVAATDIDASPSPHPSILRGDGLATLRPTDASTPTAIPTPDGICLTKPPAKAVGTTSKTIWDGVDGAAVVGCDRERYKTRFPTSMRLSKDARAYALAAGFDSAKVERMFEMFRDSMIARRSYSLDWDAVWLGWVDREVDFVTDAYNKARARQYWENRL